MMKFLTDTKRSNNIEDVFVHPHLQKYILPWTKSIYKKLDAGHLLIQEFNAVGFNIYLYQLILECPATFFAEFDKPTVALIQQSGSIGLHYVPKGTQEFFFPKGSPELIYIELESNWIRDIAYNNEHIWKIFQAAQLGDKDGVQAEPVVIDYLFNQIISNIKNCRETGIELQVELKVQMLELLNLYRKAIKEKKIMSSLCPSPHKEALLNIWQKIKSNPNIQLHKLSILSKQNFMHQKTLSRNFKRLFSVDLHSYVLDQCMQKGFHLISTTTRKIRDISSELGYKETNSFNRAFKKYFSVSPRALRL
ncbi:MAG: helix-turn-helix transcriptional regulator [Bacteroidetes bacterium]|nr:helix-turn-helix transcriptional regulator [Bacteroidota bacterium]